jgi:hypothetical protein
VPCSELWRVRWRGLELRCNRSELRTSRRFGTDDEIEAHELRVERSDSAEPFMIQTFPTAGDLLIRSEEIRSTLLMSGWTATDTP